MMAGGKNIKFKNTILRTNQERNWYKSYFVCDWFGAKFKKSSYLIRSVQNGH